MGVGLEHPADVEALLGRDREKSVRGRGSNFAAGEIEVEHRVDDRSDARSQGRRRDS